MERYCAAPWVEGVLYQDGALKACCRNPAVLGNWQKEGLLRSWQGEKFQEFRKVTREGGFPDKSCQMCWVNGTARTLTDELYRAFCIYKTIAHPYLKKDIDYIHRIASLFDTQVSLREAERIINEYERILAYIESGVKKPAPLGVSNACRKLRVIGMITRSYYRGELIPAIVAPFRQVNLVSGCNLRCIHCPGNFNGDIYRQDLLEPGFIPEALSSPEDIVSFFMNGSEFLLYPPWKDITGMLVDNGITLDISTNGMLLTPDHAQFLIDRKAIKHLNISIDGATKETVEAIRKNISFEQLLANIGSLMDYAWEKHYAFSLSFSMVLMKMNYKELAPLVSLIGRLKRGRSLPKISVVCQGMENLPIERYIDFVKEQHHTLIERASLAASCNDALTSSHEAGIPVFMFYSQRLDDFVKQGYPFPPLWY